MCSEYCIYFTEILNIIDVLWKENEAATKSEIENKMINIKDGYKDDKLKKLPEILEYAIEGGYFTEVVTNGAISYKVIKKVGDKRCSACSEVFKPFVPKNFQVGIDYVDRATFSSLAKVYDLRKFITTNIENITNATINKNE